MPKPYHLYAFGSNTQNQLGIPRQSVHGDKFMSPHHVLDLKQKCQGVKMIRGGGEHTLLLSESGTLLGVGRNEQGQLGDPYCRKELNRELRSKKLVEFEKLHDCISFCAAMVESSAYVINHSGSASVHTEGFSRWGELGRGDTTSTIVPDVNIPQTEGQVFDPIGEAGRSLPRPVIDFAAGGRHYVAILDNGEVWGWGKNRHGQLGSQPDYWSPTKPILQKSNLKTTPVQIYGLTDQWNPRRVVCGLEFTYILGDPRENQQRILGKNAHGIYDLPADVRGWKDVGATWNAIFILFENGRLTAWGKHNNWELIPPDLPRIDKIAIGSDHVLALTAKGKLISWGWGLDGNCGSVFSSHGYVSGRWNEITGIPGDIRMIGAGHSTSFVLTQDSESPVRKMIIWAKKTISRKYRERNNSTDRTAGASDSISGDRDTGSDSNTEEPENNWDGSTLA